MKLFPTCTLMLLINLSCNLNQMQKKRFNNNIDMYDAHSVLSGSYTCGEVLSKKISLYLYNTDSFEFCYSTSKINDSISLIQYWKFLSHRTNNYLKSNNFIGFQKISSSNAIDLIEKSKISKRKKHKMINAIHNSNKSLEPW